MNGWRREPFDAVIEDKSGGNRKTLQSEFLTSGRYPIVDQGKDLIAGYTNDEYRLCQAELPVIVFGDHTRCFKYVDFPFCMGADGVKVLRPKVDADVKYLYHYLRQLRLTEGGYDRHFKYLKRNSIVVPSISEQRRIAAILDKADELRAKRRAALAQLDTLTQSIFLDMFGDPATNPKGWPKRPFGEVCETRLGKMLDQKQQTGQHRRPYLRNANVQWFRFNLTDLLEMDFDEDDRKILRLQPGDLLICEGGEPGRAAVWHGEMEECYFQKALHRARPDRRLAAPDYLAWLLWFLVHRAVLSGVTSATIAHLTGEKLAVLPTMLPPVDLQLDFTRRLNGIGSIARVSRVAQTQLDYAFLALQHRAFRGEL